MSKIYTYEEFKNAFKVGDKLMYTDVHKNYIGEGVIRYIGNRHVELESGCDYTYLNNYFELLSNDPWDNLKVGDILERNGEERKVLELLGKIIFVSKEGDFSRAGQFDTKIGWITAGYVIKSSLPEEEINYIKPWGITVNCGLTAEEKKIEQCFCKSYYDDNNILRECTCGKCNKSAEEKLEAIKRILI